MSSKKELPLPDELRSLISEAASARLTDLDLKRFIKARKGDLSAATKMVEAWFEWRSKELPSPRFPGMTPDSILPLFHPRWESVVDEHRDFMRSLQMGEDREGRPIYWEKTGEISANYGKVKKLYTPEDLIIFHSYLVECLVVRLENNSKRLNKDVTQWIVVLDLKGVSMTPDFAAISYIRQMLAMDQNFNCERLHRLVMLNCPWFFQAIWALVSGWVDADTQAKLLMLGSSDSEAVTQTLDELVGLDRVPHEYGGRMLAHWNGPYDERSGGSPAQISEKIAQINETAQINQRKAESDQAAGEGAKEAAREGEGEK